MAYIEVPIEAEPVELAEEAFAYIEDQVPGWQAAEGNLESWLIESLSQIAGELRALAALVPDSIFVYFGESILGMPPYEAQSATAASTWTAKDAAGYRVTAGTLLALTPPGSTDAFAFELVNELTLPAGTAVMPAVELRALEPGAAASGITGTLQLLDQLDFVASVTLDAATHGGVDAESADAYLDRLSDLLTLLTPRPILPQDFAVLVQRTIPEVARATAIDLYNASTQQSNVPRCVTTAVVGADGEPVSAQAKADADALLQATREVNFLAFVIDPTYTAVDVTFAVSAYAGYGQQDVHDRCVAQIESYLSPAGWGVPPFGDTSGRSWLNQTKVRYTELVAQLDRVDGVDFVVSLTLAAAGGAQGTADVTLAGTAPLPRPGAVAGTVTVEA